MINHAAHDPTFVVLSTIVATFGSWTALDMFRRVRARSGKAQLVWVGAAALAMGLSIWSMHFIAMLGFDPGSPVRYDLGLTVASLLLAIGATAVAFFSASHGGFGTGRVLLAGAIMGAGICLMHYVGMAALRSAVSLGYAPVPVFLSFVVAVTASTAALIAGRRERSAFWRAAAALLLGLAIVGMHYTAMSALRITPAQGVRIEAAGVEPMALAFEVALGTIVLLSLGLIASLFDRRAEVIGAMDAGRIGYWELKLPQLELRASARAAEILGLPSGASVTYADHLNAIHPEDREARDALLRSAIAGGTDYSAEYRILPPDGSTRWVDVRGRVTGEGRGRKLTGVVLDVSARHEAYAAAEESERRFRIVADSAPALIWMSDADGRITFANRRYEEVFGTPAQDMADEGWKRIVHPEDLPAFETAFFEAFAKREPVTLYTRVLDGEGKLRWLRCEAVPRHRADGVFLGYTGCNIDVTEAKLAEAHQQLLLSELDHRVKNTLTVVMGIAAQTASFSSSLEEFNRSFMDRLSAMSRAHSLLTAQHWEDTLLRDLAEAVLAPHMAGNDRVSFGGPDILLTPKAALAMSLILHELITNAAKHGALAVPEGRLRLDWSVREEDGGRHAHLRWSETGVPGTRPPSRRGFGTKLLETSVRMELRGRSAALWREDGLEQTIEFPLTAGGQP